MSLKDIRILPSLLAADPGRLEEACLRSEKAGADGMHIDIMDGHFVRNLSMGPDVVRMARRCTKFHLSVHLMVTHPQHYAETFIKAGADTLLIHIESQCQHKELLAEIRRLGARAGITLNPETPAESVFDLLPNVDEVLCMTVHPGFGGQGFIESVLPKMRQLRLKAPAIDISVDGGVSDDTAALSAAHGANIFLAGTWLLSKPDLAGAIRSMKDKVAAAAQQFQPT
jgi:ribulose-phosphate 3-epimerase